MTINAILQTLIGGLLALGGAMIGPFFQRRHERWRAEREDRHLLRDKAQELFDDLDRVIKESQTASLSAALKLKGDNVESTSVPDLGRIRAIAIIYFPSSLPLIENFEAELNALAQSVVGEAEGAMESGEKGLKMLKALPMVMAIKHQQSSARFVAQMRCHFAKNVPKMELDQ